MNKLIIQNNKTCKLEFTDGYEIIPKLRNLLSYQQEGYKYTIAHKQSGWNGITCLLTSKYTFPSGLQNKVECFLKDNNVSYEIIDKRTIYEPSSELSILDKLKELNKEPRDYQIDTINTMLKYNKAIGRLATGAGKSLCLALLVAKLNKKSIIFVNSLSLLQQFYDTFVQIFGQEQVGFIGNGRCEVSKFNIVSIWTAATALGCKFEVVDDELSEKEVFKEQNKQEIFNLLKSSKIVCIDECHSAKCATIKNIYKVLDFERLYSFSATPFSDEGMELVLTGMLGEQVVDVSAGDLIKRKILVQPIIKFINVPAIPTYSRDYHSIYNEYIVENEIRNNMIVHQAQSLIAKGYKPLVLFKNIAHGKILLELFQKNNIKCAMLMGADKLERREEVKQSFNDGEIDAIIASSIFTTGIDIPKLSALINCSGNKGYILTIQKIGRILRSYPNKNYAAVVDFVDNVRFLKKHSEARYKIYSSEKGFIVKWVKQNYT